MSSIVFSENGKIISTALFNKINGMFCNVVGLSLEQSQHNEELYVGREVEYDFSSDIIVGGLTVNKDGTYTDNFKVIPRDEEGHKVFEAQLNVQAEQKITKEYPLVDQINMLVKAVTLLAKEHQLEEKPEFKALAEMVSYIDQVLETNKAKKEFYSNNPDVEYYSDERVAAEESARMEGGIHEDLGPRVVVGGSVFRSGRQ